MITDKVNALGAELGKVVRSRGWANDTAIGIGLICISLNMRDKGYKREEALNLAIKVCGEVETELEAWQYFENLITDEEDSND